MTHPLTQGEDEAVAALKRATSQLKTCVELVRSNNEGLREVRDALEGPFPAPRRPRLQLMKGDDDDG
jgi:hypothetical protein